LKLGVRKLRVPLKLRVPVQARFPLKQSFHVKGNVRAPIERRISIPIHQVVHPKLDEVISATVKLQGSVAARLDGQLQADVVAPEPLSATLGDVVIEAGDVSFERKP
jgi:hypothetical protein